MNDQKKPARRNRNKNRRPNQNRNRRPDKAGSERRGSSSSKSNRYNKTKLSEWDKLEKAYLILMEKYLHSRRKYHDNYFRQSKDQVNQLERNFYRLLGELRDFEANIPKHLLADFQKKGNTESLDLAYSSNHELDPAHQNVELAKEKIRDPHLLTTQANSDFKEDAQESVGSMDDYKLYKGL